MRFVWSQRKAAANLKKHGVSFEEASTAFDDRLGAYYPDALHADRFILIAIRKNSGWSTSSMRRFRSMSSESSAPGRRRNTKPRATKTTDPLDGKVDFSRFGPVRRNAFAGAGEKGGPSPLALWEMPQLATDAVMLRRGHPGKGRHRTTVVRSIRLPEALWKEVERTARERRLNPHRAMRAALLGWVRQGG